MAYFIAQRRDLRWDTYPADLVFLRAIGANRHSARGLILLTPFLQRGSGPFSQRTCGSESRTLLTANGKRRPPANRRLIRKTERMSANQSAGARISIRKRAWRKQRHHPTLEPMIKFIGSPNLPTARKVHQLRDTRSNLGPGLRHFLGGVS